MTGPGASTGGAGDTAFVVFSGDAGLRWLGVLKPGFRHCFAVFRRQGSWVIYNPLSHQTEIVVLGERPVGALVQWYREQGFTIVRCRIHPAPRTAAPWQLFTCVEAIKRLLGIHTWKIITPWQLFRYLKSQK